MLKRKGWKEVLGRSKEAWSSQKKDKFKKGTLELIQIEFPFHFRDETSTRKNHISNHVYTSTFLTLSIYNSFINTHFTDEMRPREFK